MLLYSCPFFSWERARPHAFTHSQHHLVADCVDAYIRLLCSSGRAAMSLRQLKGVDPEFLRFSRPNAQDAIKLPALCYEDRDSKPQKPVETSDSQSGQKQHAQQKGSTPSAQLPDFPKDQVFSGSYAALRCQPGSPAVRALVLQQSLAVADLAFMSLLDDNNKCIQSEILPRRQQPHRFVSKSITPSGALQTETVSTGLPPAQVESPAADGPDPGSPPDLCPYGYETCCKQPYGNEKFRETGMAAEKAKKTREQEEEELDCIELAVVDAPVNVEVSRNLKSELTHAKNLAEWDQVLLLSLELPSFCLWCCPCS